MGSTNLMETNIKRKGKRGGKKEWGSQKNDGQ